MISNKLILSLFISTLVLLGSCKTTKKTGKTTENTEAKKADPPLYINAYQKQNPIYLGLPNTIKIHTASGSTKHLEVTALGGKIIPLDVSIGLYRFTVQHAGLSVEVIAKDSVSGEKVFTTFNVLEVPPPSASIGIFRQPKNTSTSIITSSTIKEKNAIVLEFKVPLPIRCGTGSYRLIRIQPNGKREEATNTDPTGVFGPEVQKIINKATKGDIYIFTDIKTNCSKDKAADIVYMLTE